MDQYTASVIEIVSDHVADGAHNDFIAINADMNSSSFVDSSSRGSTFILVEIYPYYRHSHRVRCTSSRGHPQLE